METRNKSQENTERKIKMRMIKENKIIKNIKNDNKMIAEIAKVFNIKNEKVQSILENWDVNINNNMSKNKNDIILQNMITSYILSKMII